MLDYNSLIQKALDNGKSLLEMYGEFYAFGIDGGTATVVNVFEGEEYPDSSAYYKSLKDSMEIYERYVVVTDVSLKLDGQSKHAMRIELFDKDDPFEPCYFPYSIKTEGVIEIGDMFLL